MLGYSLSAGTLPVDQTITVTCSASDAMSGLASTTCSNLNVEAYTLSLGSHTLSATATDRAGNQNAASATFTVQAYINEIEAQTGKNVSAALPPASF